jgi:ubiquinone/menaquinone biosynthesis C-methylase UbiE
MKHESVARFDRMATNFLNSEVHQWSPSMELLHAKVGELSQLDVCDIACGAGHLAVSFAGKAKCVCAVDPAPNMLEACRHLADARQVVVETVQGYAEEIPLADGQFDLVVTRLAAHHFADIQQAVREMARLLRDGGQVAVIDLQGDDEEALDELNHQVELLHDPTHQRSYTVGKWRSLFEAAGLQVEFVETHISEIPQGVSVKRWCEIASSGSEAEESIRQLLAQTPEPMLESLGIRGDGEEYYMPVRTILMIGRK